MNIEKAKKELAYYMRRLYRRGLTTTLGGNISMRLTDGTIIITPSATDKARMTAKDIGITDIDGNILGALFNPSIETGMHLAVYRARPDVNAVVHAHPVTACAFAASSKQINCSMIIESSVLLQEIAYADYHEMGSADLAESVASAVENTDAVIMRNHGAVTLGTDITIAFERLEALENAARMTVIAETALGSTLSLIGN